MKDLQQKDTIYIPEPKYPKAMIIRHGTIIRSLLVKGPGVSGAEGDNSPFRGDTPKLIPIRISRARNPTPHISWYPWIFLDRFTEPNSF